MRLDTYTVGEYTPGAPLWKQLLWYFVGYPLVANRWLPVSAVKVFILRLFGAHIGEGVRLKTGVRVKFPWRLQVGAYAWLGEDCWIDNLAEIVIEEHVCLSQGVYLCTGNHDWTHPEFALKCSPIRVKCGSWIGAKAIIGPGVTIGEGAVLALGGVAAKSLEPMTINAGNPAQAVKLRKMIAPVL
ncbi:MAG: WcaF family extracellular polysaccharide biosynthesis acetyltransferase [Thermosynechococcaceae cyanobacterium MS004]|nr:WcaF family extracellular polysaccharide biosynthesis acetyltransferase [Thermosynechococcaceae cyanobacterium MS004]